MALLKKVKGSTLMETLVATVLIVIIFMISSMLLNSIFANSLQYNSHMIGEHLHQLQYRYQNNKLEIPYSEEMAVWDVRVFSEETHNTKIIVFEAINSSNKKLVTKTLVNAK